MTIHPQCLSYSANRQSERQADRQTTVKRYPSQQWREQRCPDLLAEFQEREGGKKGSKGEEGTTVTGEKGRCRAYGIKRE